MNPVAIFQDALQREFELRARTSDQPTSREEYEDLAATWSVAADALEESPQLEPLMFARELSFAVLGPRMRDIFAAQDRLRILFGKQLAAAARDLARGRALGNPRGPYWLVDLKELAFDFVEPAARSISAGSVAPLITPTTRPSIPDLARGAAMIRWECPRGCPAVLGPERPPRDAVVRVCLACSGKEGQKRLVWRVPGVLARAKEKREARDREAREAIKAARREKKIQERAARERIEKERAAQLDENQRKLAQMRAIDYTVTFGSNSARAPETFDAFGPALACLRAARSTFAGARLARLRQGKVETANTLGTGKRTQVISWQSEDGTTRAKLAKEER